MTRKDALVSTSAIWRTPAPTVLPAEAVSRRASGHREQASIGHATTATTALSRVTITSRRGRVDLALPVDTILAELLPTILSLTGDHRPDGNSGWVLQRLGGAPFDTAKTVAALGLRDGDVLQLVPAQAPLPEPVFDDVLDAVATVSRERAERWSRSDTRRFAVGVVVGVLCLGASLLAAAGPHLTNGALLAGCFAAVLVVAAAVTSRAYGDSALAAALAWSALPYAALAGPLAVEPYRVVPPTGQIVILGAAGVALAAVLCALGVGGRTAPFWGAVVAAVAALLAGAACTYADATAAGSAAVTVSVLVGVVFLVPALAFRLARIPLPPLPTSASDLRAEGAPEAHVLTAAAVRGDRYLTALVAAIAAVSMGCVVPLVAPGGWGLAFAAVTSVVLVLRARLFVGRAQRLWCLVAGVWCAAAVGVAFAAGHSDQAWLALLFLAVVAAVALAVAVRPADRRPSPVASRFADLIEVVLVISMLPLCGAVLDLYGVVRSLGG
jgi:type VII secretion integral membrane protein EccD